MDDDEDEYDSDEDNDLYGRLGDNKGITNMVIPENMPVALE